MGDRQNVVEIASYYYYYYYHHHYYTLLLLLPLGEIITVIFLKQIMFLVCIGISAAIL